MATSSLVILSFGFMFMSVFSISGTLLEMIGKTKLAMFDMLISFILNLILNIILINSISFRVFVVYLTVQLILLSVFF